MSGAKCVGRLLTDGGEVSFVAGGSSVVGDGLDQPLTQTWGFADEKKRWRISGWNDALAQYCMCHQTLFHQGMQRSLQSVATAMGASGSMVQQEEGVPQLERITGVNLGCFLGFTNEESRTRADPGNDVGRARRLNKKCKWTTREKGKNLVHVDSVQHGFREDSVQDGFREDSVQDGFREASSRMVLRGGRPSLWSSCKFGHHAVACKTGIATEGEVQREEPVVHKEVKVDGDASCGWTEDRGIPVVPGGASNQSLEVVFLAGELPEDFDNTKRNVNQAREPDQGSMGGSGMAAWPRDHAEVTTAAAIMVGSPIGHVLPSGIMAGNMADTIHGCERLHVFI
ncbi:hypothetical protein NE237_026492 [Protea cynaroides]|uniref:Uncharacterized protein n=1 Tax=Protea cynaroides TaxID=273540 RepID=A0A9Q0H692_9MAGN|nr:hypothetical protein NE237_026492 [Protea cynaroides]